MELVVGRVVKSHGVTGEVVVEIRTDDPADRFAPGTRLRAKGPFDGGAEGSAVSYVIESVRQHGGRLLVRLAGVADRDAADALRGSLFVIDADDLPRSTSRTPITITSWWGLWSRRRRGGCWCRHRSGAHRRW